jgi:VWFA-related protein
VIRCQWTLMFAFGLTIFAPAQNPTTSNESQKSEGGATSSKHVQLIPRTQQERERHYAAEHRIVLNVQVTDDTGKAAIGLQSEDFTLLDNGQPQKIAAYHAVNGGDGKTHILLVLDAINTSPAAFTKLRNGVARFLSETGNHLAHPVSLVVVTFNGIVQSPFSTDGIELNRELETLTRKLHSHECDSANYRSDFTSSAAAIGFSALHGVNSEGEDAECLAQEFYKSLHELGMISANEQKTTGRALVIWAGAGWPLLAGPMFQPDTAATRAQYFEYFSEMSRTLRESQVTLDFIAVNDSARQAELRSVNAPSLSAGAATAQQARAAILGPRFLAAQSGGRVMEVDAKNVATQFHDCFADADSYYVLSFDSAPSNTPNEYHRLQVNVSLPSASVRTAMFYYAQP